MNYSKTALLALCLLMCLSSLAQNVGIGTSNPNSSAILDITSNNKGILLPRVADTGNVNAPAAGLVIYNQADKAPNYFDGNKWNNIAENRNGHTPLDGSIKYVITGTSSVNGIPVSTGALNAVDYGNSFFVPYVSGQGATGAARGMDSIILNKEFDGNSIVFKRGLLSGANFTSIEIQHFETGATTPFYSIKLGNAIIIRQKFFISEKTGRLTEQYSLIVQTIGYRDWVNNKSFSYNVANKTFGTY